MSGKKTKQDPEYHKKQLKKLKKAAFDEIQLLNKTINWYEMVLLLLCKRSVTNKIVVTEKESNELTVSDKLDKTFDKKTKSFTFVAKKQLVS